MEGELDLVLEIDIGVWEEGQELFHIGRHVSEQIGFDQMLAAANLDQAPVQVAITTQAAQGVLAVPINALLAQPGGGYAVRLVAGSDRRRVAVRTGLFDETAGLVEVQGAGLAEGAKVQVPAS